MLSVPAIAITAFGAAVATQEAGKTTVRSGKMFAQLHLWCAALAKLLHLLQALCSAQASEQRWPCLPEVPLVSEDQVG